LWLPHLTSTKEEYLPMLRQLDEAGLVRQGPHSRAVILLTVDLVGVIGVQVLAHLLPERRQPPPALTSSAPTPDTQTGRLTERR
jgi:hypothetical protein